MVKVNKKFVVLFICINLTIFVLFFFYFIRINGKDNVSQANEITASMTEENINQDYNFLNANEKENLKQEIKKELKQEILEEFKPILNQLLEQNKTDESETPDNAAEQKTEQPAGAGGA